MAAKKNIEDIQKRLKGKGGSPGQVWKKASANRSKLLAHGQFFDDDGRITKQDPSVGITPSGKKIKMEVDKKKQKKNKIDCANWKSIINVILLLSYY